MRAVRVYRHGEPADALRVDDDVVLPDAGRGEARMRVEATALSLPDVMLCRGGYPLTPGELPFTLGMEASGVVTSVGDGVDPGWVGRRVVGVAILPNGALAEETLVRSIGLYPVPDGVSAAEAATTHIAFTTAHAGLYRRAELQPGETLLVLAAAGGTGNAAVQLGALIGARVIAVASGADRRAECLTLGADLALDSRSPNLAQEVRDATAGRGVDVVFDPVGGDTFTAATRCIASEGRIVLVGFAGGVTQQIPAGHLLRRNYSVMGLYMGAYSDGDENRRYMLGMHDEIMGHLASGRVRALIDRETDLEGTAAALTDLAARKVTGRPVVVP